MIDLLLQYGLFLAKTITIGVTALFIVGGLFSIFAKGRMEKKDHIEIKNLNNKFKGFARSIHAEILPKSEYKKLLNQEKAQKKKERKKKQKDKATDSKSRIFVLNFVGDIKASATEALRNEITAILMVVRPNDQVMVRLESSGGMVHLYGLAASQLQRIKRESIPLTVSVDKVAASGGYMMACVADQIIAAPFAVIGSIGVVAQVPNFNRFLKERKIDFEQFTAGKYKRTVTMFGKNTEEDREKLREELEETHSLFQGFIDSSRKNLDLERIATGEHWYGSKALELNLVDQLMTGDDFLLSKSKEFDLFEISYIVKKSILDRIPFISVNRLKRIFTEMNLRNLF